MESIGLVIILIVVIVLILVSLFMKRLLWGIFMFFVSHLTGSAVPQPSKESLEDPEDAGQKGEFVKMAEESHSEIYKEKITARILKPLTSVEDKSVIWNIICTEKAVYFFKFYKSASVSASLPWEMNLFLRPYIKAAEGSMGLETLVGRSSNAIRFGLSDIDRIRFIDGASGQIEFENKGKIHRLEAPPKEYKLFTETLAAMRR